MQLTSADLDEALAKVPPELFQNSLLTEYPRTAPKQRRANCSA